MSSTDQIALVREFAGYARAQTHPYCRECAGESLDAELARVVAIDVERIFSADFATRFAGLYEQFAAIPADYNHTLIEIDGLRLIAGIRFYGGEADIPFVSIERASRPIGALSECDAIAHTLKSAFAVFNPRAFTFTHPTHLPLQLSAERVDMHILMARAAHIAQSLAAPSTERIALRAAQDLGRYPQYRELYAAIFAERPMLVKAVRVETSDVLQACCDEGLLFDIHVDGAWAGLIAGEAASHLGVKGIEVVDIVLAPAMRGRGLGIAVHQAFARALVERDPTSVVLGTIAGVNTPSLRTALRSGRVEVAAIRWVPL